MGVCSFVLGLGKWETNNRCFDNILYGKKALIRGVCDEFVCESVWAFGIKHGPRPIILKGFD